MTEQEQAELPKSENPSPSSEKKTTDTANKGRRKQTNKEKSKTDDGSRFAELLKQNEEFKKIANHQDVENREKAVMSSEATLILAREGLEVLSRQYESRIC